MFLQRFKTPGIAHVAYLIGARGEAAVVDPRRDVDEYIAVAHANDLAIRYVVETHRQEDFVMGSAALARLTGARIVTGDHPLFGLGHLRLRDGEHVAIGDVRLRALHTPGHTPESTCWAVFVDGSPDLALGVFTGDTLFVGETGRTDLTDPRRTGAHAALLFDAVRAKVLPLGDQALVWPAHGAGSVCGGKIADRDDSTIGFERATNPVFTASREAFIAAKVAERLPRPPYFRDMERVNLQGGAPMPETKARVSPLSPMVFAEAAMLAGSVVIDTRDPEAFAAGHVPGSLNVWLKGLPVFAGWVADARAHVQLVLGRASDLDPAVTALARVGIDAVDGALAGGFAAWRDAGMPIAYSETIDPRRLATELATTTVLDVREDSEFEAEGHIAGARHLYVGYVNDHFELIEHDLRSKPSVVVTCSVGHRAGIAVSLLERRGVHDVKNLLGGMKAWNALGLPVEKARGRTTTTPEIEGART